MSCTVLPLILVDFLLFQKFLESLPCTERLRASSRDGSLSGADGKSGTNRSHSFPILQKSCPPRTAAPSPRSRSPPPPPPPPSPCQDFARFPPFPLRYCVNYLGNWCVGIRRSVILNYESGSWRPVNQGSESGPTWTYLWPLSNVMSNRYRY